MSQHRYDVIVIGSGPGGYVAAIRAAQLKKKTAIVEKAHFGGTCLNEGCIPTKVLLRSGEALKEVLECSKLGITGLDPSAAVLDMKRVQERKREIVSQLTKGVEGLLWKHGIVIYQGTGRLRDNRTVEVGGQKIRASNIIVATGSVVKPLPVKADPEMPLLTSKEMLEIEEIPSDIVIIGGGIIGIEFAYFLSRAGSRVTLVEFMERILPAMDEEIAAGVRAVLEQMGVNFYTGSEVTEITKESVLIKEGDALKEIKTKKVLISVGRQPNLEGVPCKGLGIRTERGAIVTDGTMRTSLENVYAIGDVNGKAMLAHTASMEAIVAVDNICGHPHAMKYDWVPGVVFINPEVASVGLTEAEAQKRYGRIKVGKFPLAANGKAKVAGEERGFIKVILEPTYNEILGVHMFCIQATDMIAEAVAAMKLEATAKELATTVHPHPTVSEALMEAFGAAIGKAIHL